MDEMMMNSDVESVTAEEFAPVVDVRTYFPETWLWDLYFVG